MWKTVLNQRDVVVISPQRWGGLWVSKHWIAHELASQNRVLFVEPPVWVGGIARAPRTAKLFLQRLFRPLRKVEPNLFVFTPVLNLRILGGGNEGVKKQLQRVTRRLDMNNTIVFNFGTKYEQAKQFRNCLTVYYCVDPALTPEEAIGEEKTCQESDLIYAVSEAYRKHLAKYVPAFPISVIPHGYSFDHARKIAEHREEDKPSELAALSGPIIGFVGSIHDSVVDIQRLEFLSRNRPNYNFVLIGPYKDNPLGNDLSQASLKRMTALPNVHLLGSRHFMDVPRYVKHFDVGLVLINNREFDSTLRMGKRTLFKWLMYLAQGKPVVASRMTEAAPIEHLVFMADNDQDFLNMIDVALEEGDNQRADRIQYASQFSFDKIMDRIAAPIRDFLAESNFQSSDDLSDPGRIQGERHNQ